MPIRDPSNPTYNQLTPVGLLLFTQTFTAFMAPSIGSYAGDAFLKSKFTRHYLTEQASHIFGKGRRDNGTIYHTPDLVRIRRELSDAVIQFGQKNRIPVALSGLVLGAVLTAASAEYLFDLPHLRNPESGDHRYAGLILAGSLIGGITALFSHSVAYFSISKVAWRFKEPSSLYVLVSLAVGALSASGTWLYAKWNLAKAS